VPTDEKLLKTLTRAWGDFLVQLGFAIFAEYLLDEDDTPGSFMTLKVIFK
jgi:hypothetical protein